MRLRVLAALAVALSVVQLYRISSLHNEASVVLLIESVPFLKTATPSSNFPLWLPPTPTKPVVGLFGDYQWVYPTLGNGNSTAYALRRFVANELTPWCSLDKPCCAIGSKSGPGHTSGYGRGLNMNFMAEFQPLPPRPLFSLVDALKAWRQQHTAGSTRRRMKLVFIGDSITSQVYTAALCELARNAAVEHLTYDSVAHARLNATNEAHETTFHESHVKLKGDHLDYELLFIRQFAWTQNAKAMQAFLLHADVIVLGLGLHYSHASNLPRRLPMALQSILGALRATQEPPAVRNRTLILCGDPRQHFRYSHADTQVTGLHEREKEDNGGARHEVQFCGPVARFPADHPQWKRSVSAVVLDMLTNTTANNNKIAMSASWFRWNATREELNPGRRLHLHILPFYELTSPFYQNKAGYNANTSAISVDCSHILAAPNFYESVWDAMYLLISAAAGRGGGQTRRFPAGTQQFPRYVPFNGTLDFENITRKLANEVL